MDRSCTNCHQYFDIREHNGKCPYCLTDNFKNKNMKNFKNNQNVKHPKYCEGVINIDTWENKYVVTFNEVYRVTSPIGDDFYNELEPVEDLPEVGEYAYFWNAGKVYFIYGIYKGKTKDEKFKVKTDTFTTAHFDNISKNPPTFD
jgi:hypothetical protein